MGACRTCEAKSPQQFFLHFFSPERLQGAVLLLQLQCLENDKFTIMVVSTSSVSEYSHQYKAYFIKREIATSVVVACVLCCVVCVCAILAGVVCSTPVQKLLQCNRVDDVQLLECVIRCRLRQLVGTDAQARRQPRLEVVLSHVNGTQVAPHALLRDAPVPAGVPHGKASRLNVFAVSLAKAAEAAANTLQIGASARCVQFKDSHDHVRRVRAALHAPDHVPDVALVQQPQVAVARFVEAPSQVGELHVNGAVRLCAAEPLHEAFQRVRLWQQRLAEKSSARF
jgi:hypothetical protein